MSPNPYETPQETGDEAPEPKDRRALIMTLGAALSWAVGLGTLTTGAFMLGIAAVFFGVLLWAGGRSLGDD